MEFYFFFKVMSQAGTSIGALALTSPTGTSSGTILTHHPTLQRTSQDHHIPLKTPIGQSSVKGVRESVGCTLKCELVTRCLAFYLHTQGCPSVYLLPVISHSFHAFYLLFVRQRKMPLGGKGSQDNLMSAALCQVYCLLKCIQRY